MQAIVQEHLPVFTHRFLKSLHPVYWVIRVETRLIVT